MNTAKHNGNKNNEVYQRCLIALRSLYVSLLEQLPDNSIFSPLVAASFQNTCCHQPVMVFRVGISAMYDITEGWFPVPFVFSAHLLENGATNTSYVISDGITHRS